LKEKQEDGVVSVPG